MANVEVDRFRLEEEWEKHSQEMLHAALKEADAQEKYDVLVQREDELAAEIAQEVRKNPGDYGIDRVTEGAIKEAASTHPEVRSVRAQLVEAKHLLNRAKAYTTALEHRKRALTKLVDLWIRDYYSDLEHRDSSDDDREILKRRRDRAISRKNQGDDEDG